MVNGTARWTCLAKQLVDISMTLGNAFHKVVELIDKVADVDAAHRKGLRERHRAWKRLSTTDSRIC